MQMHASAPYMGQQLPLASPGPASTDVYLDDISRQIGLAQLQNRRYSPTSSSHVLHAHGGSPMRITKPTSTSNSPRSAMQARRRTMVNDNLIAQRNQLLLEQACLPTSTQNVVPDNFMRRPSRPVSWHPSSQLGHMLPQQQMLPAQQTQHALPLSQYPFPAYNEADFSTQYQQYLPPTPAVYSAYNSPTGLSPLALPYSNFQAPQYAIKDLWTTSAPMNPSTKPVSPDSECPGLVESTSATEQYAPAAVTSQGGTSTQWNSLMPGATPPTPDSYPAIPAAPEPVIPTDESIPYRSLDEEEDDGEILVGMGLYDPPEKGLGDYTLNTFRSSTTSLFGGYEITEPKGKGLKLEETWVPPPQEEEDEDESNSDDDADAEEQE
ncbi:hypothetical protein MCOR27_004770 [Pyricularia oryzae]|uniref:Uncharacterized protein n=2 Tax=Pyricularia TaxID=48558 RepID=A0ABQ8NWC2_PYRGI|nr:hypothetical protein MCOR01_008714 [Pyricularia oryzae]KAI6303099.1 hypothetical protein MCOR33_001696 [Pyricularia grisea]KAH9439374.1 hypothetical protein MCOR02_002933 [Pyricularia oryzae]KAI6255955.1 hypothetical protein MCOR19_007582 [Pyricularia oryzae]KAI6266359.1 hypothetical protein MCOR26_010233 [Pyricularia oryzae]